MFDIALLPHGNLSLLKHAGEVLGNVHNYLSPTPFRLPKLEMLSPIHSFSCYSEIVLLFSFYITSAF